jgi:hypothetical protein
VTTGTRIRSWFVAAVVAAVLAAAPRGAAAQKVQVSPMPGTVVFNQPTAVDFNAGFIGEPTMALLVQPRNAKKPWQLFIRAGSADMGGYGKPVSDVLWRTDPSSAWTSLTTSYQQIAQGTGTVVVYLYFRTRLQWSQDVAGTYDALLEFGAQ